jgi:ParB/RepB/Spo0J family partition protein
MNHVTIPVSVIHPNPHRNFKRNPLNAEQVEKILDSIGRTGFWDNIVVRPHPDKKGEYQLAYGHSRLAALKKAGIKEVTLPVADLSDWDMYQKMVLENETQRGVTPQVAFENVEAGVQLLEKAFTAVGKEGTLEQFNKSLGRVVPRGTTRDSQGRTNDGHAFEQARAAFFAGEGIGRRFIVQVLPSKMGHSTVNEVLNSHYGTQREEAKRKKAEAAEKEAGAKRRQAMAAKDRKEAERLRAEAEAAEAEAAEAEAKKLAEEAKKIGGRTVKSEILLLFGTSAEMTEFAAALNKSGVDRKYHQAAADHILKEGCSGKQMAHAVDSWWYETSGQAARDRKRRFNDEAFKRFQR